MSTEGYFLNSRWEILWTASGNVVFNSPVAEHITLRDPAEDVVEFIKELEQHHLGTPGAPKPIRPGNSRTQWFARELCRAGVISRQSGLNDLAQKAPKSWERYRSFIAHLGSFREQPYDEAAYVKLQNSSVAIVGLGGVGSLVALMLASCNIGKLAIIDPDVVSDGNLVRQILFSESDALLGRHKVDVVAERISGLNSAVSVSTHPYALENEAQAVQVIQDHGVDLVLLTADRPRILIQRILNRACLHARSTLLNCFMDRLGPIVIPGETACFECVETHWRNEVGSSHDEIVDALQLRDRVEYPSSVMGVARAADAMTTEAVLYLAGAPNLCTRDGILRLERGEISLEHIFRIPGCPACSML